MNQGCIPSHGGHSSVWMGHVFVHMPGDEVGTFQLL